MYAYCTSSHMSKQFKKWPIKYHFGWLSWPAKIHIKYCTLVSTSQLEPFALVLISTFKGTCTCTGS